VRFREIDLAAARALSAEQERLIEGDTRRTGSARVTRSAVAGLPSRAILHQSAARGDRPSLTVRQDGDACVLVEYGPMVLDLALRFRVEALLERLALDRPRGIVDLTPGVRSLHIHYDDAELPREELLDIVIRADRDLPNGDSIEVPSRIVHLPLSWEDPATLLAIQKYMQSVRADAPWCPSNIEFIRRINGLASVEDVKAIVFGASYLVLGLGDVYLGAPVATPVDPRHRLVTTKYNPARTWTPENAVGIGGAYLCVYGMEGPGGYQFVGRTCQMWNRIRPADPARPWLLRFFDQIRFFPVTERELLKFREDFPRGRADLAIEPTTFRLADYRASLGEHATSIAAFKARQQAAFEEERERWASLPVAAESEPEAPAPELRLEPGQRAVRSQIAGSVWQLATEPGQHVRAGDKLVVLETMKMETVVAATEDGVVVSIHCRQGMLVHPGALLVVLESPTR
jgi:urea carboxylase